MESGVFLDMPDIAREQRVSRKNHEQLLALHPAYRGAHEFDPSISRFRSLRGLSQAYEQASPTQEPLNQKKSTITNTTEIVAATPPLGARFEHDPIEAYSLSKHLPKLWTPIWLRKLTLCLFASLFLSSIAGLLVLWHFSVIRNGYDIATSDTRYAWTYGPTALLVVIVGLWRQVDYHCKLLAPWDELRKGPVVASRSLLADYISPFHIVSIFAAFRQRNLPVILSITVFVLLKIITLFSTSLFILLPTTIHTDVFPATATSNFTATAFDPTTPTDSLAFPSQPVYARLGNIAYNLPSPIGVTDSFAYIPVTLGSNAQRSPEIATYDLETSAFVPSLVCSTIDVNIANLTNTWLYNVTAPESSPDAIIHFSLPGGNGCDLWPIVNISTLDPRYDQIPSRGSQIVGRVQGIGCADNQSSWTGYGQTDTILITVADVHYTQTNFTNQTVANSSRVVTNMANVLCLASYRLTQAHLWNNTAASTDLSPQVFLAINAANSTLDNFSSINLTNLYLNAWGSTYDLYTNDNTIFDLNYLQTQNNLFKLMAAGSGTQDLSTLLVDSNLQKSAESTFNSVMSYYASSSLTSSGAINTMANATYQETRLHLALIPFWIIVAGFATVTMLCVLLILIGPGAVVPRDPSTIAATATILARSTDLNRMLQKNPNISWPDLKSTLDGHQYGSAIATTDQGITSFQIVVSNTGEKRVQFSEPTVNRWLPFGASLPFWMLAVTFCLALIAALEVLQQLSDRHEGLLTTSASWKTNIYIHFIPALIMLFAATSINNLDFNIALFSPWSRLAKGDGSADQTVLNSLLGRIPPMAILKELQLGYWSPVLSTVAAVLASVFIIVVSGLYEIRNHESVGSSQDLVKQSSLSLQNYRSGMNASGAANIMTMMTQSNLEYPLGTYDELALPFYSLPVAQDERSSISTGPFTARVPALRGNLRCNTVPSSAVNIYELPISKRDIGSYHEYDVMPTFNLPEECQIQQNNITTSNITLSQRYKFSNTASQYILGTVFDLTDNATTNGNQTSYTTSSASNDLSCPSLALLFGQITAGSNSSDNITAILCYQEVQTITTNITFNANTTTLDLNYPPLTDEASVVLLSNPLSANGSNAFDFHVKSNMPSDTQQIQNQSTTEKLQGYQPGYNFDEFFTWCIFGTKTTDPNLLLGTSNTTKLLNVINHTYRRYMAQFYSLTFRDPNIVSQSISNHRLINRQESESVIQAQSTIATPRLVQDKISKIILQVLLGTSVILITIAYFSTPMRKVIPINPCSIAGRMSLLAGSKLCCDSENATCVCCGKPRKHYPNSSRGNPAESSPLIRHRDDFMHQLKRQIIINGTEFMPKHDFNQVFMNDRYSMGWWRGNEARGLRRRRYGIDIGSRADGDDEIDAEAWRPLTGQSPVTTELLQEQSPHIGVRSLVPTDLSITTNTNDDRGAYQRAETVSPIREERRDTYQENEAVSPILDTEMSVHDATISRNTSYQRPHTISSSIYDEDDREDQIIDSYRRDTVSPSVYDEYDETDIGIAVSDDRRESHYTRF